MAEYEQNHWHLMSNILGIRKLLSILNFASVKLIFTLKGSFQHSVHFNPSQFCWSTHLLGPAASNEFSKYFQLFLIHLCSNTLDFWTMHPYLISVVVIKFVTRFESLKVLNLFNFEQIAGIWTQVRASQPTSLSHFFE